MSWVVLPEINQNEWKKRSEATQTLRAGCSKADPQINTQTDRGDYNTLRCLARSLMNELINNNREQEAENV